MKCCYCKKIIRSKIAPYCVPADFPRDKEHELKPLCKECGGSEYPTLDEICTKLDWEKRKAKGKG